MCFWVWLKSEESPKYSILFITIKLFSIISQKKILGNKTFHYKLNKNGVRDSLTLLQLFSITNRSNIQF